MKARDAFPDTPLSGEELVRLRLGENGDPAPVEYWWDVGVDERRLIRVRAFTEEEAEDKARNGDYFSAEGVDRYVTDTCRLHAVGEEP